MSVITDVASSAMIRRDESTRTMTPLVHFFVIISDICLSVYDFIGYVRVFHTLAYEVTDGTVEL